jgi:nucleoside-diphosphate-sugar epimerase
MYKTYHKKYNIIYFSSSDVYINTNSVDNYITELTPIKVDINRNIALYGEVKIIGETIFNTLFNNKILNSLKILRPFNISGKYQH